MNIKAIPLLIGLWFASGCVRGSPSAEDYHLRYTLWSGVSPGDDFDRTSLTAVELDIEKSRIRWLRKTAHRPEPMLPWHEQDVSKMLDQETWLTLKTEESNKLATLISQWLSTNPPQEYHKLKMLGREDGYHETLSIRWRNEEKTSAINPRQGDVPPPPQWNAIVDALVLYTKPLDTAPIRAEALKIISAKYTDAELQPAKGLDGCLEFSHKMREFVVYRLDKAGNWQKPSNDQGPDRGGIRVRFTVRKGPWTGALAVPHTGTTDLHVFRETHVVKNSADGSCHIWAEILTPKVDAPDDVKDNLVKLFNDFEKHIK